MKHRRVKYLLAAPATIYSTDTFPELKWSLLAQALSHPVTEAGMPLLLDPTTFWGGRFILCQALCSWPWGAGCRQEAPYKRRGTVSGS